MAVGVIGDDGTPLVNSRDVAELFGKRHGDVMDNIVNLLETDEDFRSSNKSMGYDVVLEPPPDFGGGMSPILIWMGALIETGPNLAPSNNSMGYRSTQFCVH